MTMRPAAIKLFIILQALAMMFALTSALGSEVGTFTFVNGRVDILKPGEDTAVPVETGAPVGTGDILRTKSNARAEITFSDGTILRLAEKTRTDINAYHLDESGAVQERSFYLSRGKVRAIIPQETPKLEILTPNARADAKGTDFYFIYEKGSTWFYGSSGTLLASSVEEPGKWVPVKRRACVRFGPARYPQAACTLNEIDEEKYAWDTAAREDVPVVATLPAEGEVYTYTPLGGKAVDTPSMPVAVPFDDIACSQCPPIAIPLTGTAVGPIPTPVVKMGNFERIDKSHATPAMVPPQ